MLLAIDVRNTHTVVGLIAGSGDHAKVEQHWRIRTEPEVTADELALTIDGLIGEDSERLTGSVGLSTVPCGSHTPPARCPAPVPIHDDGDVMGRCVERGCHGVEEGVARRGHTLCGQRNVTYHGAIPASSEGAGTWWLS